MEADHFKTKELQMEAAVHDSREMTMLLEGRILNSVPETVVDGIINIGLRSGLL
jgi:hypothetical protein